MSDDADPPAGPGRPDATHAAKEPGGVRAARAGSRSDVASGPEGRSGDPRSAPGRRGSGSDASGAAPAGADTSTGAGHPDAGPPAERDPPARSASAVPGPDPLLAPLLAGDRRALSRAITLVESTRPDHRARAEALLEGVRGAGREALRIGLSGTPGVGKSTFVDAFGTMLTAEGLRVAVLAVDPSSARTGGSILGDKTRMDRLARDPRAYVRPSPAASHLGGVARRSREATALCEAAGFDVVLIETVGVGQSETMVAGIADLFVLLLAPAGGDELQGVKRGIMEIADLILVNKADGDLRAAAMRTVADYAGALHLLRRRPQDPDGIPAALPVSALDGTGLTQAWARMQALAEWRRAQGHWAANRTEQAARAFDEALRHALLARLDGPEASRQARALRDAVAAGEAGVTDAVATMLGALDGSGPDA